MSKKSRIKTADIALTEEQVAALLGEATTLQITHDGVLSAMNKAVSYTHLTLPTTLHECRSRWSPYH